MKDTSKNIEIKYREMLMSLTPEERLKMASRMFDTARKLVIAGILKKNKHLSPSQLRIQIFLRFYGKDFSDKEKTKIIDKIAKHSIESF